MRPSAILVYKIELLWFNTKKNNSSKSIKQLLSRDKSIYKPPPAVMTSIVAATELIAQDASHACLLRCIRESPRVAEAYANLLAAKTGNPYNIPAAINLLTDAISELPTSATSLATTAISSPLRADRMAAAQNMLTAARQAKLTEDVVYKAFLKLRACRHGDEASTTTTAHEALIAAIRKARIAISAVSDSLQATHAANAALNAASPNWALELFGSSEVEAELTAYIVANISRSTKLVDTAEEAVLKKTRTD